MSESILQKLDNIDRNIQHDQELLIKWQNAYYHLEGKYKQLEKNYNELLEKYNELVNKEKEL